MRTIVPNEQLADTAPSALFPIDTTKQNTHPGGQKGGDSQALITGVWKPSSAKMSKVGCLESFKL